MRFSVKKLLSVMLAIVIAFTSMTENCFASGYDNEGSVVELQNDEVDIVSDEGTISDELSDDVSEGEMIDDEDDSIVDIEETSDNEDSEDADSENDDVSGNEDIEYEEIEDVSSGEMISEEFFWPSSFSFSLLEGCNYLYYSFDQETSTLYLQGSEDSAIKTFIPKGVISKCNIEEKVLNVVIRNIWKIEDEAFAYTSIKSVTFDYTVERYFSIGKNAFSHCSLKSITIPKNCESIGSYCFYDCEILHDVTIESGLIKSIPDCAFYLNTMLVNVVLPEGITTIGEAAFSRCYDLENIKLPDSLKSIGENAFANSGLKELYVPGAVNSMGRGCFYSSILKKIEFGEGMTKIDGEIFDIYGMNLETIIFPQSLKIIGDYVFSGTTGGDTFCNITWPENLEEIGDSAFHGVKMDKLVIPKSLNHIGRQAFYNAKISSGEIIFPANCSVVVDANAFAKCQCGKIVIGGKVNCAGGGIFYCASFESLTVNGILDIDANYVFEGSEMSSLTVNGTMEIASSTNNTFNSCRNLVNVNLNGKVDNIADYAFAECTKLSEITIPSSVIKIGEGAFYKCTNLKTVNLSDGLQEFGASPFIGTSALDVLYLPTSLEKIGDDFLKDAPNLRNIYFEGTESQWKNIEIGSNNELLKSIIRYEPEKWKASGKCGDKINWYIDVNQVLSVYGEGDMYDFSGADEVPWNQYALMIDVVSISDGITSIGDYSFYGIKHMKKFNAGSDITKIGDYALNNCSDIQYIDIPKSVTEVGDYAFENCTSLININFHNADLNLGRNLLSGCSSLETIELPGCLDKIAEEMFKNCKKLTEITIPETVISVEANAFYECTSLTSIIYKGNRGQWNKLINPDNGYVKEGNDSLLSAQVKALPIKVSGTCGEKVKWSLNDKGELKITGKGDMANYDSISRAPWYIYATDIKSVSIGKGVKLVGSFAFYNCTNLEKVSLGSTINVINGHCFENCSGIKQITIPKSIKRIENQAFRGCSSIESLIIPEGATYLGTRVFVNCTNLILISLPKSLRTVENDLFGGCINLSRIIYGGTEDQWAQFSDVINGSFTVEFGNTTYYFIEFDGNGGTGSVPSMNMIKGEEKKLNKNTFTRPGYIFAGWKNGKKVYRDEQLVKNLSTKKNATVKLVAQWKADTGYAGYEYIIHFDGNGSTSGLMSDLSMKVGSSKTLPSNKFTKTGSVFGGWTVEGSDTVYKNKQSVKDLNIIHNSSSEPINTITLKAIWNQYTYTVTYNGNGGKNSQGKKSYTQVLHYDTEETLTGCTFTKVGYSFEGWSIKAKANEATYTDKQKSKFNLVNKNKGKITLYAVWKPLNQKIVFEKASDQATGKMNPISVDTSKSIKLPALGYVNPGYYFDGWKCSDGKRYKDMATISKLVSNSDEPVVMTAIWGVNTYTVRFNSNGGTGVNPETIVGKNNLSITIPVCKYKKELCTFVGWNTAPDGSGDNYSSGTTKLFVEKNADLTLYPIWEYNVLLDSNSDEDRLKKYTLRYNHTQTIPANIFTKTGYILSGWNTSEAAAEKGKVQYKTNCVKNVKPNSTLYAVWKPIKYTIVFDANGGTGKMKNQVRTYDKAQALPGNTFKKKGYVFVGWKLGNTTYENKENGILNMSSRDGTTVKLVAQWERR